MYVDVICDDSGVFTFLWHIQGRDSVSAEDIQKAVQLVIIPRATTLNNPPEDDDDQQPPPPPPPPPPQDQQQARHGIVWRKGLRGSCTGAGGAGHVRRREALHRMRALQDMLGMHCPTFSVGACCPPRIRCVACMILLAGLLPTVLNKA